MILKLTVLLGLVVSILFLPSQIESGKIDFYTQPLPWRILVVENCEYWMVGVGSEIIKMEMKAGIAQMVERSIADRR